MATNNPKRKDVVDDVVDVIHRTMKMFGRPKKNYTKADLKADESISLARDLRLNGGVRSLMAIPYTKISKDKHKGASVTQKTSNKATTVKKAIDLVHKQANDK